MKPTRKKRQYSVNTMQKALKYVRNKKGSIREAARRYGVPRSSIQFKVTHPNTKCTSGPSAVLTEAEESALVNLMLSLDRRGFPRKRTDIQLSAQNILEENPRKNPFRDNCPNAGWYMAFLRRHPEISVPVINSASVTEDELKMWYTCIRQYINDEKLFCVITDPKRLFIADATSFKVCPDTGKVFTNCTFQNSTHNITVFYSFSATGLATYPMLIYPNNNIPENAMETMPSGWGCSCSTRGKTTADAFHHYIKNVLHPDLVQKRISFPIILFVDRKTPVTLCISELCHNLDIHLIAMYPNGSHIQSVVCQSLKTSWRKGLRTCYQTPLTKSNFSLLFGNIFNDLTNHNILIEAFHKLGLFPFDEENIDCSKEATVLKETIEMIEDSEEENDAISGNESEISLTDENVTVIKTKDKTSDLHQHVAINTLSNQELQDNKVEENLFSSNDVKRQEVITPDFLDFQTGVDILESSICDICMDNITETIIECCKCFNKYHHNCIPNFHKNLLLYKEFVCHVCN